MDLLTDVWMYGQINERTDKLVIELMSRGIN